MTLECRGNILKDLGPALAMILEVLFGMALPEIEKCSFCGSGGSMQSVGEVLRISPEIMKCRMSDCRLKE
jgi:hypothetical protein